MADSYALVPLDASDEEIRQAGVDPDAERFVPFLGYIHSDDVGVWVGVAPVSGRISLSSSARGEFRSWVTLDSGGEQIFVNTSRLAAVQL